MKTNKHLSKIAFCIFSLLSISLFSQKTDWEKYEVKGQVKTLKTQTITYSGGCEEKLNHFPETCISEFDKNGNIIKNTWLYRGQVRQVLHYQKRKTKTILKVHFYEKGKMYREKIFQYQSEKELEKDKNAIGVFTFEAYKDNILEQNPHIQYKYDEQGNWTHKHDDDRENKGHCQRTNIREIHYY